MVAISISMAKTKGSKNGLFEKDLRKEWSPSLQADVENWKEVGGNGVLGVTNYKENMDPSYFSNGSDQIPKPMMSRVDSYKPPVLNVTLATIEEDKPGDLLQRSRSVPVSRSLSLDLAGHGLSKLPSYRRNEDYGVTLSGPITFQGDIYREFGTRPHRSGLSRMRHALRRSRLREAFGKFVTKMKFNSRRSS